MDEWTCANGLECIPESILCDGSNEWGNAAYVADCSDSSDESIENCCSLEYDNYKELRIC